MTKLVGQQLGGKYDVQAEIIGNALDDEAGDTRPLQVFENGFMVYLKERGRIVALYTNGAWTEMN